MDVDITRELILRSQQGDLEAREQLVQDNFALVRSVARRFLERGIEYDDLIQIASLGLVKAINDFDLSYEVKFSTYAVPKIIGEIRQHLRRDSTITVSRSIKKLASEVISVKDSLGQRLGKTPTISQIASELGAQREEVVAALEAVAPVQSLQTPLDAGEDGSSELQDLLGTNDRIEHLFLKHALERLEAQEKRIIFLRYFAEKSQSYVADNLGISQAQVSRIEARIIRQLRYDL
ncbi:MAG: sigma-70 family RNA polymerase sigma factor [Bacillota bacterium]|nr:sigma-70 family RNA polymerase sigma factor [Bacillota bacterium]